MRRMLFILLSCLAASPAMAIQPASAGQSIRIASDASRTSRTLLIADDAESSQSSLAIEIERRVVTDWMKYDSANDGYLSHEEFSHWMNDLRAENGNGPAEDEIMQAAFLVADTDKDMTISKDELTEFMMSRNRVKRTASS